MLNTAFKPIATLYRFYTLPGLKRHCQPTLLCVTLNVCKVLNNHEQVCDTIVFMGLKIGFRKGNFKRFLYLVNV